MKLITSNKLPPSRKQIGIGRTTCYLREFYPDVKCSRNIHIHHIMNEGKLSSAGKAYVNERLHIFGIDVCENHNIMRWADTKGARKFLLMKKIELLHPFWGFMTASFVAIIWDSIPWKVVPHELIYAGVMAADIPWELDDKYKVVSTN